MSSTPTQPPSATGAGDKPTRFEQLLGHRALADVSVVVGLIALLRDAPLWLRVFTLSLLGTAAVIYNRRPLSALVSRLTWLPARARNLVTIVPTILLICACAVGLWQIYITFFKNEVPIETFPHTLHSWGDSSFTQRQDDSGRYERWEYTRDAEDSYAGLEYDFGKDRLRDLEGFDAVQIRLGYEGENDACKLYLKESPERDTGDGFPLDRTRRYPAGVVVSDPLTIGTLLVETVTIPLRENFPNTNLDRILALGVQAGGEGYPLSGVCRVYSLNLLRSFP